MHNSAGEISDFGVFVQIAVVAQLTTRSSDVGSKSPKGQLVTRIGDNTNNDNTDVLPVRSGQ